MNAKISQGLSTSALKFLVIALLALGIFCRFVNLDQKAYWLDEAFTSLHLSGYSDREVENQIVNGGIVSVAELLKYQYPSPEKTVFDTVDRIAETAPELPPLYFAIARFWLQLFGNSITALRSLSAIISLLVFPSIYWLCLELFKSPSVGWIALALIAVSPFHVLFAQEARPYSLWTVIILLSNASLLRAMRLQTKLSWNAYAVTVILGLYTHLFSALLFFTQGVYAVLSQRFRLTKTLICYGIASVISLIAFAPWLYPAIITISRYPKQPVEAATTAYTITLVKRWIRGVGLFFADFSIDETSGLIAVILFSILLLFILALVGYSIYYLFINNTPNVGLFVLISIAIPPLVIILLDLMQGQIRSTISRYFVSSGLFVQLTVAYLLANKLGKTYERPLKHQQWKIAAIALLSVGVLSCVTISQSPVWWTKAEDKNNHKVAEIINKAKKPLIVSDAFFVKMFPLSHVLDEKVKIQLLPSPKNAKITQGFSDVFLYKSSQKFIDELKQKHKLKVEPVYPQYLWQVKQKN
ncbi:glycosyltransferase family 39 protein [Microseira sp. BLCC-F43]|uniref:glycosyltransferase family 39 protein n=1 Tax=Microseira sp. BLCC-F43 TaxID=3153602 RepID=UPI0035BB961B